MISWNCVRLCICVCQVCSSLFSLVQYISFYLFIFLIFSFWLFLSIELLIYIWVCVHVHGVYRVCEFITFNLWPIANLLHLQGKNIAFADLLASLNLNAILFSENECNSNGTLTGCMSEWVCVCFVFYKSV